MSPRRDWLLLLSAAVDLDLLLSAYHDRVVQKDRTVVFGKLYLRLTPGRGRSPYVLAKDVQFPLMYLFGPVSEPRSVCLVLACLLCASCGQHALRLVADASANTSDGRDTAPLGDSRDAVFDRSQFDRLSVPPSDASAFRCVPSQGDRPAPQLPDFASAMVLADLDGDGTADLAATIENQDVVVIMPGCGGGSFGESVRLATGRGPAGLAVVDVNGDGKLDLAVSNRTANTISILTGTGGGAFGPKVDYPVEVQPGALVAGDFDGDGHPDLAVACSPEGVADVLTIVRNRGDGTFVQLATYEVSDCHCSLATGDLGGDGRDELAVTGWGSMPVTVFSWGSGGDVTRQSIGENANSVIIDDLNGDGHRDLAWSTGRGVKVALNRGDGNFAPAADYDAGPVTICTSWALTAGDVSGDGKSDLLVLNDDCEVVTVIANRDDGTFAAPTVIGMEDYPNLIVTGDLNGDARADLVVSTNSTSLTVLLAQPDGSFALPVWP